MVAYLNDKTGKNFRASTAETQRHICARIEDGYTLEDFKRVIDVKCKQWLNTEREIYLRPKTLFIPSNFDSYLNDFVNKTYDENSNCFKLAKCFENFIHCLLYTPPSPRDRQKPRRPPHAGKKKKKKTTKNE
ncbi:hypothetical protein CG709_14675, partial [Lachnotalea glycerini]